MKNRTLTNIQEVLETANKCDVCYVAMAAPDGIPYVVPMNFGLDGHTICFHSAQTGKKIDLLKQNPNVCVAFSTDHVLRWQHENVACSYSMKYRSILAHGTIEFVTDLNEKINVLNVIMRKYTGKDFKYNAPSIHEVQPWIVKVHKWEGRVYGY